MDSLLSSPIAQAVVVVAAILTLVLLWKALQGALRLVATIVFVPLIVLTVFRLNDMGFLDF